jgi:hypothetical protein
VLHLCVSKMLIPKKQLVDRNSKLERDREQRIARARGIKRTKSHHLQVTGMSITSKGASNASMLIEHNRHRLTNRISLPTLRGFSPG